MIRVLSDREALTRGGQWCQRRYWQRCGVGLAPCLLLVCAVAAAEPDVAATTVGATSQRSAREEAIRCIPWKQLNDSQRRQLQTVIQNASMYRRLPTRVVDCDPDLFTFLLQHPEVVVDVWRMMGVSKVSLQQTAANSYRGNDGCGTTGDVAYFYTNWGPEAQNLAVVYAEGAYDGKPFLKPLKAQTVMVLQSAAIRETNGRNYITVRVDSFVHVQHLGVELVTRTVQPWINQTADRNFIETLEFVSTFSQTAEKNPQGMQRLAARLQTVDEPTREELVNLCFRAAQRYAKDDSPSNTGQPYVLAQRVDFPAGTLFRGKDSKPLLK